MLRDMTSTPGTSKRSFGIGLMALAGAIFLAVHVFGFSNAVTLSGDMVYGDGTAADLTPPPRYRLMRVPATPLAAKHDAANRLAADFAQIYFCAQQFDRPGAAYNTKDTLDPWHRPALYAPLTHWLCLVTVCKLPYGYASLGHVLAQYLLFLLSFVFAFKVLAIMRHLPLGLLLVNGGLFLTPVGLSWFERGQFSLYVGSAYLWLFLGLYKRNALFLILAALFAYVKWTSFPAIFVVLCLWILTAKSKEDRIRILGLTLAFAATIVVCFLLFLDHGLYFLSSILTQELSNRIPYGISLMHIIPRWTVKILPVLIVALGWLGARRYRLDFEALFPFLLGASIVSLLYPTAAYEYNVPSLFGLIPFAIHWALSPDLGRALVGRVMAGLFILFLAVAAFSPLSNHANTYFYLVVSVIMMALPLWASRKDTGGHGLRPA